MFTRRFTTYCVLQVCKVADHIGVGVYFNTLVHVEGKVGTPAMKATSKVLFHAAHCACAARFGAR